MCLGVIGSSAASLHSTLVMDSCYDTIRYDLLLSYCVENVFTIENTFVIESGGHFTHANAADGKFAVLARPA